MVEMIVMRADLTMQQVESGEQVQIDGGRMVFASGDHVIYGPDGWRFNGAKFATMKICCEVSVTVERGCESRALARFAELHFVGGALIDGKETVPVLTYVPRSNQWRYLRDDSLWDSARITA